MKYVDVTVTVATDENDTEKAKENAETVVAQKLATANTDKALEDGKIYEITEISETQ